MCLYNYDLLINFVLVFAEHIAMEGGVATCRGVVLDMLADVLCGDRLAAEYTLLHLISSM